jgi:hypothetical protein
MVWVFGILHNMWEADPSSAVSFPAVRSPNRAAAGKRGSQVVVRCLFGGWCCSLKLGFHSPEMKVELGDLCVPYSRHAQSRKQRGMASDKGLSETHRVGRQMQAHGCAPSAPINLRLEITDLRALSALSRHLPDLL